MIAYFLPQTSRHKEESGERRADGGAEGGTGGQYCNTDSHITAHGSAPQIEINSGPVQMTVRAYGYENNKGRKKKKKHSREQYTTREREKKVTFFRICSVYTRSFLAIIHHGGGEKPDSGLLRIPYRHRFHSYEPMK